MICRYPQRHRIVGIISPVARPETQRLVVTIEYDIAPVRYLLDAIRQENLAGFVAVRAPLLLVLCGDLSDIGPPGIGFAHPTVSFRFLCRAVTGAGPGLNVIGSQCGFLCFPLFMAKGMRGTQPSMVYVNT